MVCALFDLLSTIENGVRGALGHEGQKVDPYENSAHQAAANGQEQAHHKPPALGRLKLFLDLLRLIFWITSILHHLKALLDAFDFPATLHKAFPEEQSHHQQGRME